MENYKRIGLYGVSGTGKTTILSEVSKLTSNAIWLEGSKLVIEAAGMALENFKKLSEDKKYFFREKAIEMAWEIQVKTNKHIIIDGHLVFAKSEDEFENVMTSKDATFYTDYIYLNLPPEIVFNRLQLDTFRKRNYSISTISNWIEFEMNELKTFCNDRKLNLHILHSTNKAECVNFICNYLNL
jgi:adenylate kinase